MRNKIFTDEMKDFIQKHYKGVLRSDLCQMLNIEFGTDIPVKTVRNYCNNHNLRNGVNTQFGGGIITHYHWAKGTCSDALKKTQFKKGHVPHNTLPVGSTYTDRDGYVYIKIAEPDVWKQKHYLIWEKINGKVPESSCVVFLDGNKQNYDINNLMLVTRAENCILNKKRMRTGDVDLDKTAILTARLISKTCKRGKRNE